MNHPERIKLFGWFLHVHRGFERFKAADIKSCYVSLHLDPPANPARFLESLAEKKPKELLKDASGYRLAHHVRTQLDSLHGKTETVLAVEKILADLPGKLADEGERLFLSEALTCYRHGALRAAIVMTWNLAYDHLLRWLLSDAARLASFIASITQPYQKKAGVVVIVRTDFEKSFKESEVLEIAGHVTGFSGSMKKIMKEKLDRRNTYAHPSLAVIARPQVDDMITDLINNIVLALPLS